MRLIPMIAAPLVVGLGSFGLASTPAQAKQCVWNKAGFVLRIDWFNPQTIEREANGGGIHFTEQPVQTDVIWAANGRCIDRGATAYDVVLSVCGRNPDMQIESYPADWSVERRIDCGIWRIITPSTNRYLDVWGPLWAPESGPGGPI